MTIKDKFDAAASFIVEEHIRVHDKMVPHPDRIKDANAKELRDTFNEAIDAVIRNAQLLKPVYAKSR